MEITDLNFDCLESCLQHLNFEELLVVADCNKQLNYTARHIISRRFKGTRGKTFNITSDKMLYKSDNQKFKCFRDGEVLIMGPDLKFCLQVLRSCGDLFSEMECDVTNSVKMTLILSYVNEYCSEFLTKIYFTHCPLGSMARLTKPFKKVEELKLFQSFAIDARLSGLFPNLRKLVMGCYNGVNQMIVPDYIFAGHYPSLEHLSVVVYGWENNYENLAIFLRSNPQIKFLDGNIWFEVFFHTKIFSFEHIQSLEKLHLTGGIIKHRETTDEKVCLRNLKELYLELLDGDSIPFRSDTLESLELVLHGGHDGNILKLISNYPNVKRLKVSSAGMDHLRLSITLPSLEEIDFSKYWIHFTVDEVVRFIHEFHSLRSFRFVSLPDISADKLRTQLGNRWLVSAIYIRKSSEYARLNSDLGKQIIECECVNCALIPNEAVVFINR